MFAKSVLNTRSLTMSVSVSGAVSQSASVVALSVALRKGSFHFSHLEKLE
jgi:hypothetical protein